jgi:hypothetical protein
MKAQTKQRVPEFLHFKIQIPKLTSVADPHHNYVARAPRKIFQAAPASSELAQTQQQYMYKSS